MPSDVTLGICLRRLLADMRMFVLFITPMRGQEGPQVELAEYMKAEDELMLSSSMS